MGLICNEPGHLSRCALLWGPAVEQWEIAEHRWRPSWNSPSGGVNKWLGQHSVPPSCQPHQQCLRGGKAQTMAKLRAHQHKPEAWRFWKDDYPYIANHTPHTFVSWSSNRIQDRGNAWDEMQRAMIRPNASGLRYRTNVKQGYLLKHGEREF